MVGQRQRGGAGGEAPAIGDDVGATTGQVLDGNVNEGFGHRLGGRAGAARRGERVAVREPASRRRTEAAGPALA